MSNKLGIFMPKNIETISRNMPNVNVVKASSVLPELPKTHINIPVVNTIYTSPFAPTGETAEKVATTASKHIDIFA